MPIDRNQLLTDVKLWLPESNVLSDAQILSLAEKVISEVGDDQENYPEVLCKTLKSCGKANKVLASGNMGKGIKREKVDEAEVEYHADYDPADTWDDWINNLPCLCTALGYSGLRSKVSYGFYANVPTPVQAPKCSPPYGSEKALDCNKDCLSTSSDFDRDD